VLRGSAISAPAGSVTPTIRVTRSLLLSVITRLPLVKGLVFLISICALVYVAVIQGHSNAPNGA